MNARTRARLLIALGIATVGVLATFLALPPWIERTRNRVLTPLPPPASAAARALHGRLLIADLHADSLLWHRDLSARGAYGHVDLPRLREGNVGLQVFSIVTRVPRGLNIERNDGASDDITALALVQRWPVRTWVSATARAHYQAQRLDALAQNSNGTFRVIRTAADLAAFLDTRRRQPELVAGLLSVEGAHALEGDLANLDLLFDAGVRLMAPSHFFDNEIGGSAHGVEKTGLSVLGRRWVQRMEQKRMVIDLAHASARTMDEVLATATRPVIVSHAGVRGTCDNTRNLTDAQLKAVAANGGVIGIGFWETAVCGKTAAAIARAIRYAADRVGVAHVALGSDFDGAVTVPFDASGLSLLTDALLAHGFSETEVEMIMGQNVLRVLMQGLPQGEAELKPRTEEEP